MINSIGSHTLDWLALICIHNIVKKQSAYSACNPSRNSQGKPRNAVSLSRLQPIPKIVYYHEKVMRAGFSANGSKK